MWPQPKAAAGTTYRLSKEGQGRPGQLTRADQKPLSPGADN